MNGCEQSEVALLSLPVGAAFEVTLSRTTSIYGIVRKHLAGSILVDTVTDRDEHFQFECPVVPHFEVTDAESWLTKIKGERNMGDKVKKAKTPKKEKVTIFEVSAKESKELSAKDNDSQVAIIYQAIEVNGPCDFDGLWSAVYRKFQASKAPVEKQKINVRTYVHRLIKAGFVKRSKKLEASAAA